MRVIDPGQPTEAQPVGTTGLTRLLPNSRKLAEAGFVFVLGLIGLFGFRTTFDSWFFLAVSGIGLAIGIVVAYLVRAVRWHWTLSLVGAVVAYFVFGGPIAVRQDLIARIVPTWTTETSLYTMALGGWKQLLTTLPPVDGEGSFLALPFLLALVFGAAAYGLARAFRLVPIPLIPLVILFGLVIALGTDTPAALLPQGVAWVVVAAVWGAYRNSRQNRLTTTAATKLKSVRLASGAALVVVAGLVAGLAGPYLPGVAATRDVLRDHVQSPIDLNQYPSPMPSFRKFSSEALQDQFFYNSALMDVKGAGPGELIRFAVLDSYDGLVWGAGGGGFRKVGTTIPTEVDGQPVSGEPVTMTITMDDVYASQAPLNIWVPSLGYATQIEFSGSTARGHEDSEAYDLSKGQGIVLDQFKSGDVVNVTSIPMPVDSGDQELVPSGSPLVSDDATSFIGDDLAKMTGGNVSAWEELQNMAAGFKKGAWSDGTATAADGQYTPGDGQNRLKAFLATMPAYVGSDEQYAAMFALAANRIGFPARVVFGAQMPSDGTTTIKGQNVTIWVEVHTTTGWVALPPSFFIPSRDQTPQPPPPTQVTPPQNIQNIAPANPKLPPDNLSNMDTQAQVNPPNNGKDKAFTLPWWGWAGVWTGVAVVFLALLVAGLLGAKTVRSWWRHNRGSPAHQIAAGWADVIDRLRDLGVKVPRRMTRQEQAAALGLPPLARLATTTDRAMFSPTPPDREVVDSYWDNVNQAKDHLLTSKAGFRKFWTRITPRSLMPAKRLG